ncbi:unnamed protein product, partial [Schistosoma curassoni]|uniref:Product n=1 Tax=Schistosoma curassoni TaxID=6186 RepID=A0A183JLM5_9TREM
LSSSSTSHRSRSAPPCSEDTSEETSSSPISVRYVSNKPSENISSQISTNVKNSVLENSSNVSCILPMYAEEVQPQYLDVNYSMKISEIKMCVLLYKSEDKIIINEFFKISKCCYVLK